VERRHLHPGGFVQLGETLGFLDRVAQAAELVDELQAARVFAEPDATLGDFMDAVALQAAAGGDDGRGSLRTRRRRKTG